MTVRELLAELEEMDPDAEVRLLHLRRVMKDGSGRVESYPVVEVAKGDDGEVALSDFVCEGACLFKVKQVEWEQPALKGHEDENEGEAEEPELELPAGALSPVDTLLVNPPFTREEWSKINLRDIGEEDLPLGKRVMEYLRQYHRAVMGANRLHDLMAAAGLPLGSDKSFSEGLLQRVLQRLFERDDSTVHGMEVMMATVEFIGFLKDQQKVPFGPEMLDWLRKVESLVVLRLVVCVNKHFGLIR